MAAEQRVVSGLASALKKAREDKGWTQRGLADEMGRSGRDISSAYVGLIEAGRRIPTVAVVRALADVLECDPDELIQLRSQVGFDKIMAGLRNKRMSDIDPEASARGRQWVQEFIARHGDTPTNELKRLKEARDALDVLEQSNASPSGTADGASAWLAGGGGPRRGRRYELATRLFELVADLNTDEIQRIIGYTEAVREDRQLPAGE